MLIIILLMMIMMVMIIRWLAFALKKGVQDRLATVWRKKGDKTAAGDKVRREIDVSNINNPNLGQQE